MRRTPLTLITLALAGLLTALAAGPAQADPATGNDRSLAIGVVNTTHILRTMHEAKKLEDDYRAKAMDFDTQQKQRTAKLQDMQKHRDDNFKPGSSQWTEETDAIDTASAELQVWATLRHLELDRMQKQGLKSLYDHIAVAASEVAQQQHLDLVIADQAPEIGPDLEKANIGQLQAALAARAVLYSDKKADITEDVLTRVEANFKSVNPAVGPSPATSGPTPTGGTGTGPRN